MLVRYGLAVIVTFWVVALGFTFLFRSASAEKPAWSESVVDGMRAAATIAAVLAGGLLVMELWKWAVG